MYTTMVQHGVLLLDPSLNEKGKEKKGKINLYMSLSLALSLSLFSFSLSLSFILYSLFIILYSLFIICLFFIINVCFFYHLCFFLGFNNTLMQLQKICNHPYLFLPDNWEMNDDLVRMR